MKKLKSWSVSQFHKKTRINFESLIPVYLCVFAKVSGDIKKQRVFCTQKKTSQCHCIHSEYIYCFTSPEKFENL